MRKLNIILILLFALIITQMSCKKILFGEPNIGNSFVFEQIWQYIDDYYCCHEFVSVNWDSIYQVYDERVDDDMDSAILLALMDEMLQHLQDPKVGLITSTGKFNYEDTTQYLANLDTNTVKLYNPTSATVIIDGVGYVNKNVGAKSNYPTLYFEKGLIVDLRDMDENTQSEDPNVTSSDNSNIGLFLDVYEEIIVGNTLIKTGPGEDNYLKEPLYAKNFFWGFNNAYENPVIVLINRKVAAQWSKLAFELSTFPNVTLIGDKTSRFGQSRTCNLLSNGWFLECPDYGTIDLSDNCVSCVGVKPDIYVDDDPATTNIDEIIEEAFRIIN